MFALLLLLTAPIGASEAAAPQPIEIAVLNSGPEQCIFAVAGRTLSPDAFKKMLEAEPDKTREIHISAQKDAAWRCVSGAVYNAQQAGFKTVGFISTPQPD